MSKKSIPKLRLAKLLFAVIVLLLFADAVWYEPRHPVLSTYNVSIPNLPQKLDGFRIVQLSDIHCSKITPECVIERAVRIANSTSADAAVFTGDLISHDAKYAEPCCMMLAKLKTRNGSFAVLGNHDHWSDVQLLSKSLTAHNITLLSNTSKQVVKGLYLVGIDDKWAGKPDVNKAFRSVDTTQAYVMLSHTPLGVKLFNEKKGLLITGHTHGGQVLLPFIPRNRLPGLKGWKYINGWYKEGDIIMYVNRGVGMINPSVRFRCRPEVTLYILHSSKSGAKHPHVID